MLTAGECKLAQSFPADYVILGNQRDQVRQIGNANPPGSSALSWRRLPLPSDLPAGARLAVRVVDLANGQPLAVADSDQAGWLSLPLH